MSYHGYKNKETYLLSKKKYHEKHKPKIQEWHRQYYLKHRGEILAKKRNRYGLLRISLCVRNVRYRRKIKAEVLTHYGKGKCACIKCGFGDLRALSIDHINGGGRLHRQGAGIGSGSAMYVWLKKNNYPSGFQTLCLNCQWIKRDEKHEYRNYLKQTDGFK